MGADKVMAKGETYEEFIEKFKPKKTTDDCYTPPAVYDAVKEWACNEYNIDRKRIVRPFWPGADYQKYDYKEGDVVLDNPPFSIESKIMKFYKERNIHFFLFAPGLTLMRCYPRGNFCCIGVGAPIIYDNGAVVSTSFVTDLDQNGYGVRSCPELYDIICAAVKASKNTQAMPKYDYSDNVLTSAMLNQYSKYGVNYHVDRKDAFYALGLDSQKEHGKSFFGGGLLLSEKAAAEKAAAEKAAAEKRGKIIWELSEREKEIIKTLGAIEEKEKAAEKEAVF